MSFAAVVTLPSPLSPSRIRSQSNLQNVLIGCTSGLNNDGEDKNMLSLPIYKWRLTISYDGTRFSGWQFQQSAPTVQRSVEEALTKITKLERDHIGLVGAGRTDAGVHAWGQVAHFNTPFNYDSLESTHKALNGLLPSDIRIREICSVVPEFHARFSVTSKIYIYKIYNDTIMDPFQRHHAYHSVYKLNADAIRCAARHFVGKHDFSAFANASRNDRMPNPVKYIFRFDVHEMGALLQLEVEGSGFLYRQVRNMVALLLQVGKEAVPADIVPKIMASRDRKELAKYALSVPPHGLCLYAVNYKEDHLKAPAGLPLRSLVRHAEIALLATTGTGTGETDLLLKDSVRFSLKPSGETERFPDRGPRMIQFYLADTQQTNYGKR